MRLIDAHDIEYEHICGEFRVSEEKINAMPTVCNTEQILNQIREEIINEKGTFPKEHYIRIIDKYKAKSEDKNEVN